MKKIRCFVLGALLLCTFAAGASAVQLNSNGDSWFLADGRIVQTQRTVTEAGPEYPGILCYDQNGELQWTHTFTNPAIGRSDCQLLEDGAIAFMYYDENHQYFLERFNLQGELTAKGRWEPNTKGGLLFENGMIFCEKFSQQKGVVLSVRYWDEREKHWVFQGVEQMTLYSARLFDDRLYIEIGCKNDEQESAHIILCVDTEENIVLWSYRMETEFLAKAYTSNEQGGITLFVQSQVLNDQYEMYMITLDEWGAEQHREKIEGIPATMAINVVRPQENGLVQLWGYGYDTYGENGIIHASLNKYGDVVKRTDIPVDYATCVQYLNDEIYVMIYENGIGSFELMPFEIFAKQ